MKNPFRSIGSYLRNIGRAILGGSIRSYRAVIGSGGSVSDWPFSHLSEDADLKNNQAALRDRARSLFQENCHLQKYTEELWANVPGEDGIRLRMKVKETEDRTVYAADEKAFLDTHIEKMERVREHVNRKLKREGVSLSGLPFLRHHWDRAKATVKAGDVDLYACTLIENAYKEWQRAEFCTMTGNLTYNEVRQLRILACARDGDFFLRMIRGKQSGNKFGFSLQLINSEWCDFNLNVANLPNGNSIRMGVELNPWGKPVAYHFIKRSPWDWQFSNPGLGVSGTGNHERIDAVDIIHYRRAKFADSTRGAPWIAAAIIILRQLGKFEEAEVVAARVAASKMGFIKNTMMPEGGIPDEYQKDPCKSKIPWNMDPGSIQGLEYGQEFQEWNPNHPTQNYDQFRKGQLRTLCAGLPGAEYSVMANDLENVNFSAGRLGRLDSNEMWKLLQRLDIDKAERPIFEAWLEMALATGAIPLPLAKFAKYNKPHFTGRRWAGVDPIKETQAAVLAIQNKLMSYTRWYDDQGWDLEEEWMQIAEEQMLAEELGIDLPKAEGALPADDPALQDDDDDEKPKKKPKGEGKTHFNGNHRPPALVT